MPQLLQIIVFSVHDILLLLIHFTIQSTIPQPHYPSIPQLECSVGASV
jgi:hypothetical protein